MGKKRNVKKGEKWEKMDLSICIFFAFSFCLFFAFVLLLFCFFLLLHGKKQKKKQNKSKTKAKKSKSKKQKKNNKNAIGQVHVFPIFSPFCLSFLFPFFPLLFCFCVFWILLICFFVFPFFLHFSRFFQVV